MGALCWKSGSPRHFLKISLSCKIFTYCNCHGSGCNKDWDSAGETSSLECYQCNSEDAGSECSDTIPGELARCGPGDKGCFISQATYGSDVAFERGCTEVSDQ